MAEHEPCIGATSDWRSPPEYFGPKAIDLVFDMDVASPGLDKCFVPAKGCFTIEEDGLKQLWRPSWLIFMNPPFGGRIRKSGLGFCAVIEPNRVQLPLDWCVRETCHV